jgi:putative ABC transport system permease protein
MTAVLVELKQSLRSLLRQPGFLFTAILILALGIGAVSAVFSVVHGVLLKPLPYPQAERVLQITRVQEPYGGPISRPAFLDWQAGTSAQFSALAAYSGSIATLVDADGADRLNAYRVTPSFWEVLALPAQTGRYFGLDEENRGERVVVLAHALWQSRFGGRSDVLGRSLRINGEPYTVIGVAPPALRLPEQAELYLPTHLPQSAAERGTSYLSVLGRLAEGVSLEQAEAALKAVNLQLAKEHPNEHEGLSARLKPLPEALGADLREPLWILLAASALVLLTACANLANLLLARGSQRAGELAVRAALGAARARLLRMALSEALLIACLGGAFGLLLAAIGVPLLLASAPDVLPSHATAELEPAVVAISLAVSLLTVLAFALLPALRVAQVAPAGSLQDGGRSAAVSRRGGRARRALVVAEVALALTLLAGAGLMIESLRRLGAVDAGISTDGVLTASLVLSVADGPAGEEWVDTYRRHTTAVAPQLDAVLERVSALPGVEAVGLSDALPLSGLDNYSSSISIVGAEPTANGEEPGANWRFVNPDYFRALGLAILQGRGLLASDARAGELPNTVLVNRTFAERYLGTGDVIGRQIEFLGGPKTVVGVVADTRPFGLERATPPEVYMHHHQAVQQQYYLALKVRGEPQAYAEQLRAALHELDPAMPVSELRPFAALASERQTLRRFNLQLMAVFSAVALGLAAIGLYGVIAFGVEQRRQELGIRMSLGADSRGLLALLMRQNLGMVGLGIALGLVGALLLGRALASQLFGVSASDPLVLLSVITVLAVVAVVACLIPTLRAVRASPLHALRGG